MLLTTEGYADPEHEPPQAEQSCCRYRIRHAQGRPPVVVSTYFGTCKFFSVVSRIDTEFKSKVIHCHSLHCDKRKQHPGKNLFIEELDIRVH
eukprot:4460692-Karenia_brevis.AAC.1